MRWNRHNLLTLCLIVVCSPTPLFARLYPPLGGRRAFKAMRQEIAPAERRARVICKLLGQNPELGIDKLRVQSMPDLSGAYTQRRRELRRLSTPNEFESAIALAVGKGWVTQTQYKRLVLTAEGREIGLRTRAGMHRSRSIHF